MDGCHFDLGPTTLLVHPIGGNLRCRYASHLLRSVVHRTRWLFICVYGSAASTLSTNSPPAASQRCALRGSFLLSGKSLPDNFLPFLDVEQRVEYLYARDYFNPGTLTDEDKRRLSRINFHYFLGYARNYRMLVGRNKILSDKSPSYVFSIIDKDHELSEYLYRGLRKAEWRLRATAVALYCEKFPSTRSFLKSDQFKTVSEIENGSDVVASIVAQTLRYGEPYVKEHVEAKCETLGIDPRWKLHDSVSFSTKIELIEDLPLWAIVDGFSFGLLTRFVERCDCGGSDEVWRNAAKALGIPAAIFSTNLRSLVVLRNQVAHHSRLWMKPTTDSPRPPKLFARSLRGVESKSPLVGFYNLAMFQGDSSLARTYAAGIEERLGSQGPYRYGISRVHHV